MQKSRLHENCLYKTAGDANNRQKDGIFRVPDSNGLCRAPNAVDLRENAERVGVNLSC